MQRSTSTFYMHFRSCFSSYLLKLLGYWSSVLAQTELTWRSSLAEKRLDQLSASWRCRRAWSSWHLGQLRCQADNQSKHQRRHQAVPPFPLSLSLSFHAASVSCRRWLCLAGHIRKRKRERGREWGRGRQQSRAEGEAEQARRVCDLTVCDKFYFCSESATSVYPCPLLLPAASAPPLPSSPPCGVCCPPPLEKRSKANVTSQHI